MLKAKVKELKETNKNRLSLSDTLSSGSSISAAPATKRIDQRQEAGYEVE